jgi:hypothetical protein
VIPRAQFVEEVIRMARLKGCMISANKRDGEPEIDFGDKRLRAAKVAELWPAILAPGVDVAALIDRVAPGKACAHGLMREIVDQLRLERRL